MWNSVKSVKLSGAFTKIVIILVIGFAVSLPVIKTKVALGHAFILESGEINYVMPVIYICCFIVLVALFSLNQLLSNIKKDMIFVEKNVRILRRISWCCLTAALVLLFGSFFSLVFLMLSMAAGFVGLILRVVKNVFQAAVELKTEADFTV